MLQTSPLGEIRAQVLDPTFLHKAITLFQLRLSLRYLLLDLPRPLLQIIHHVACVLKVFFALYLVRIEHFIQITLLLTPDQTLRVVRAQLDKFIYRLIPGKFTSFDIHTKLGPRTIIISLGPRIVRVQLCLPGHMLLRDI